MKKSCVKNFFSIMLILTLIFNPFSNFTFAKENESDTSKSESIENSQPLEDDNKTNEERIVEPTQESININLDKYKSGQKRFYGSVKETYVESNTEKDNIYKILNCDLGTSITFNIY